MRRSQVWMFSSAAVAALALAAALASPVQARRGGCPQGGPSYDRAAETTFTATVQEVAAVDCQCRAGMKGTRLQVTASDGPRTVQLGPSDFVASGNVALAAGDLVEIVGAPGTCMGQEVVLARTVRKGGDTLTLRDEAGRPRWAGQGRGRGRRS